MSILYDRKCRVTLEDLRGATKVIEELRVSFYIERNETSTANSATISIYNLSRGTREALISRFNRRIRLDAGYGNEMQTLFIGDIIRAVNERDDVDIVTNIECADGMNDINYAYMNVKIPAGIGDKSSAESAVQSFSDSKRGIIDLPLSSSSSRSQVVMDRTCDYLDRLSKNHNANWYIDNGLVNIIPKDKAIFSSGILLNEETGLIGSPMRSDDGLEVRSLINKELKISSMIVISSIIPEYNGSYKVSRLAYTGDTDTDDWYVDITCVGGLYYPVQFNF